MPDNPKPTASRWKIAALLAALLVPCAVIGGNYVLQSRARQSSSNLQAQTDAFNASLQLTPEGKQVRLERAKELREKWRPWALKHQTELRQMLQADKGELELLVAVWSQIPSTPNIDPSLQKFASAYQSEDDPLSGKVFTWNAIQKAVNPNLKADASSDERERYRKIVANQSWNQKHDFDSFRDVVIGRSMQSGTIGVALWASGRVTETNRVKTVRSSNKVAVGVIQHKELVPPYDFLTNSNSKETT